MNLLINPHLVLDLLLPLTDQRGGADDQSGLGLDQVSQPLVPLVLIAAVPLPLGLNLPMLHDEAYHGQGLPQPHVIGQDAARGVLRK